MAGVLPESRSRSRASTLLVSDARGLGTPRVSGCPSTKDARTRWVRLTSPEEVVPLLTNALEVTSPCQRSALSLADSQVADRVSAASGTPGSCDGTSSSGTSARWPRWRRIDRSATCMASAPTTRSSGRAGPSGTRRGTVLPAAEPAVAADQALEGRDLLGAGVDQAVDVDVRAFGAVRDPLDERRGVRPEREQRVVALDVAVVEPVPAVCCPARPGRRRRARRRTRRRGACASPSTSPGKRSSSARRSSRSFSPRT